MLLWHGQVPFCYSLMFKKFLSFANHSIIACAKGKRIVELNVEQKFLLNIYFMAMRKLFNRQREHLNLKMVEIRSF